MTLGRAHLGLLGGLAGESLLTGIPRSGIHRLVRESVELDVVPVILGVLASVVVESPRLSESDYEPAAGWYPRLVGWSFYGAIAAVKLTAPGREIPREPRSPGPGPGGSLSP